MVTKSQKKILKSDKLMIYDKGFLIGTDVGTQVTGKQGLTFHRPIAHSIVFRHLSYSTMLAEHAVHRLRQCPAFGPPGHVCSCLFSQILAYHHPNGWAHDHDPTNVRAMVKILYSYGFTICVCPWFPQNMLSSW